MPRSGPGYNCYRTITERGEEVLQNVVENAGSAGSVDRACDENELDGERISYSRNRGVMILTINNNNSYHLLGIYCVQGAYLHCLS